LREQFRKAFLKGLRGLHRRGELKLEAEWSHLCESAAFDDFLQPLEETNWVAHITPPPENSTPEHVLKYLARYLTGGPISDRRLISAEHGQVTFWARSGTRPGGDSSGQPYTLKGCEFVRRWSLHILPHGYTKTRRFGGFSNCHRQRYLTASRELLPTGMAAAATASTATDEVTAEPDEVSTAESLLERPCPHCQAMMRCVAETPRPGWFVVLRSPHRPRWYDDG
jgi:hypothetical protein